MLKICIEYTINALIWEDIMNKKMLIAIAIAVAVIVVGAVGFTVVKGIVIKSNPVNYLLYSATHNQYEAVDMSFTGAINIEEEALSSMLSFYSTDPDAMAKFVTAMVDGVTIDGGVKWKMNKGDKKLFFSEEASINYADKPLFTFGASLNEEQLTLGSETLLDKSFVVSKNDLFDYIKSETEVDLNQVNFDKYIDLLDMEKDPLYKAFKKDIENYVDIAKTGLESLEKGERKDVLLANGKSVKCDVLTLSIKYDEMLKLYIDLMTEAKSDEELKALFKGKMIEALNLVISSEDYILLNVESSDVTAAIEELETNFDTMWTSALDEAIFMYQELLGSSATIVTEPMLYSFAIDSKYNLRQVVTSANTMGIGIEQTMTYNAYGDEVKTEALFGAAETVQIMELINDPDLATQVGTDALDQGLTNIIESEALSLLMTDLEEKSSVLPTEEQQAIVEMVKYFFENQDMLKDMIIDGMGL